jgi:putative acetyltransferase
MEIRALERSDNKRFAEVIRSAFEELGAPKVGTVYSDPTTDDLYTLFQHPRSACFVAVENGRVIGGCGIYPTEGLPEGCAELVKFYLAADYRGKGIGSKLMKQCTETAFKLGYTQLYLESLPQLATAVSMYERAGFKTLAAPLGNSGHYSCTLWMLKEL